MSQPLATGQLSRPAELAVACAVAVCVTVAIIHVGMVFLYVAPANTVSQRYQPQLDAWINPYFEQNWQLFAPNPQSVREQISARTLRTTPGGVQSVSAWTDLTAVDDAAVRHDPFPSHTNQNMLRRAWSAYADLQGNGDQPGSPRAEMLRQYLRNIAAQRVAEHDHSAFDAVQLRVVDTPIAPPPAPGSAAKTPAQAAETRLLPWWRVRAGGR